MPSNDHEPGRSSNSSGRDQELQRLVAGFFHGAGQLGYHELNLERVALEAGVPLTAVEARFSTKDELLVAAKEEFVSQLWDEVSAAFAEQGEWPAQVKAGLNAGISFIADAGPLARFFIVEATLVSLVAAERQSMNIDRFIGLLRDGRQWGKRPQAPPEVTEELLLGGVLSIVTARLRAEDPAALKTAEPELLELLLMPYLGPAEARRLSGR